jgi:hypothetical protein
VKQVKTAVTEFVDLLSESVDENTSAEKSKNIFDFLGSDFFEVLVLSSRRCWTHMKKMRGSALCATCSGRSQKYFINNKIIVDEDTCLVTVDECKGFFRVMSNGIKDFSGIVAELKQIYEDYEVFEDLEKLQQELAAYLPPLDFLKLIESVDNLEENTDEYREKSFKICSRILNIRKLPYMLVLNPENIDLLSRTASEHIKSEMDRLFSELRVTKRQKVNELKAATKASRNEIRSKYMRDLYKLRVTVIEQTKDGQNTLLKQTLKAIRDLKKKYKGQTREVLLDYKEKLTGITNLNARRRETLTLIKRTQFKRLGNGVDWYESNWQRKVQISKYLVDSSSPIVDRGLSEINEMLVGEKPKIKSVFDSDSVVVKKSSDNMFTAVDSNDDVIKIASKNYLPMNTSLTFP